MSEFMLNRIEVPEGFLDFHIDDSLVGAAMKDELLHINAKLVFWTEQHGKWDARKKILEARLEEAKDKARAFRAKEAQDNNLKAKIQESYIRDIWDVSVVINGTDSTPAEINSLLAESSGMESETRHRMNLCNTAIDIGRTALSWDKAELSHMGGGH